ncbi:Protein of unknown function [Gryllus bimaculatus]|nr:Protein of unknown function [Gryllus bimaculatus]
MSTSSEGRSVWKQVLQFSPLFQEQKEERNQRRFLYPKQRSILSSMIQDNGSALLKKKNFRKSSTNPPRIMMLYDVCTLMPFDVIDVYYGTSVITITSLIYIFTKSVFLDGKASSSGFKRMVVPYVNTASLYFVIFDTTLAVFVSLLNHNFFDVFINGHFLNLTCVYELQSKL